MPKILKKPQGEKISLLDLDNCLQYAVQKSVLTKKNACFMTKYACDTNANLEYWDLYWEDVETRNGMNPQQAKAFEAFYKLFKAHEILVKGWSPHILFDVSSAITYC